MWCQSSDLLPEFEASAQCRSCSQDFTLLDGDLRCCSWNLPEPLSQFQGHSSQCSYYHWNLHSPYLLQLFFQPLGIFLKLLVFLLPDAAVPWDCCIYHHCQLVSYHQCVGLVSTTSSSCCITTCWYVPDCLRGISAQPAWCGGPRPQSILCWPPVPVLPGKNKNKNPGTADEN